MVNVDYRTTKEVQKDILQQAFKSMYELYKVKKQEFDREQERYYIDLWDEQLDELMENVKKLKMMLDSLDI